MPAKVDRMTLGSPFPDRRVKLLPCQKERMKAMRKEGLSLRQLAKVFHVDKRTVQFVCDPEKLEACQAARARRGGSKRYYVKHKNTEAMRKHRKHKERLFIPDK